MGEVYLAVVNGPGGFKKLVVVKVLRLQSDDDDGARQMFLDEGRLAARLNHQNVVHTYEVGAADGVPYIAMEYLEGQPLSKLVRSQGPFDTRIAAGIISSVLAGLHYAHELRDFDGTPLELVHRDLSPPNIFLTYEGVVKLVDFGIAKTTLASRSTTEVGILKGKLGYMAPEQANGEEVDRRADIFAAGAVLWELLSGHRLIEASSPAEELRAILSGNLPRISNARKDVDPKLEKILDRALQIEAANRYPTAQAMREDLEDYIAASGRPLRSEELGQLVSERFADHRARIQALVQTCVAASDAETMGELPVLPGSAGASESPTMDAYPRAPESDRLPSPRGDAGSSTQASSRDPSSVQQVRQGKSRAKLLMLVAGALAVLASAGWHAFTRRPSPGPTPTSAAGSVTATARATASRAQTADPGRAPDPSPPDAPVPSESYRPASTPSPSHQPPRYAPTAPKGATRLPSSGPEATAHLGVAPQNTAPPAPRTGPGNNGKTESKGRVPLLLDHPQVELVE